MFYRFFSSPLLIFGAVWVGFSGCTSSVEVACEELPRLEKEAAQVSAELTPYAKFTWKKRRRVPASTVLPSEERSEQWLRWAEGALKESQSLRDTLQDEVGKRSLLEPLNETTQNLVYFHGFVSQKKFPQAKEVLERFQASVIRFRGVVCAEAGSKK